MVDEPSPPDSASLEAKTEVAVHNQTNLQIKTLVPPILETWSNIVEARCAVYEGRLADASRLAQSHKPPVSWATVDLGAALAVNDPDRLAQAKAAGDAIKLKRILGRTAELRGLFESLPETETQERIADYRQDFTWLGVLWAPKTGFTLEEHPAEGFTTVKFESRKAPLSLLEDMAVLKAADIARHAGKSGLIILDRRNINHTVYNGMATGHSLLMGFESQLDFVAVDPAAPPPAYRNARWRIADANAVYAALAPLYIPPDEPKGR